MPRCRASWRRDRPDGRTRHASALIIRSAPASATASPSITRASLPALPRHRADARHVAGDRGGHRPAPITFAPAPDRDRDRAATLRLAARDAGELTRAKDARSERRRRHHAFFTVPERLAATREDYRAGATSTARRRGRLAAGQHRRADPGGLGRGRSLPGSRCSMPGALHGRLRAALREAVWRTFRAGGGAGGDVMAGSGAVSSPVIFPRRRCPICRRERTTSCRDVKTPSDRSGARRRRRARYRPCRRARA